MSKYRLRRRLRALLTMRAALTCVLALLVVSSGSLALFNPAAAAPDGIDDEATFTVRTGGIFPHATDGGQICAEKIDGGVNKVTVTDSKLKDVDIYLGKEGGVKAHVSFPSGEVNGALVLYTNGENLLVNTLSLLGVCLPPGVPNPMPTTLEAYWLGVDNLETQGTRVTSGGDPPEADGPSLKKVLETTNTSPQDIGYNNSSDLTDSLLNNSSGEWVVSDNEAPTINNTTANDTATPTPTDTVANNSTQTPESATNTSEATGTETQTTANSTESAETQTSSTQTASDSVNETASSTDTTNTPTESTTTQSSTNANVANADADVMMNMHVDETMSKTLGLE